MKTKLFAGLSIAVLLLAGGPAFAHGGRSGGGGGGGGAFHGGGSRGGGGGFTSGRSFAGRGYSGRGGGSYYSPSFGFGGTSYRSGGYGNHYRGYGGNGWVVVDPDAAYPYYGDSANYGSDDAAAAPAVNNAAPVSVQIQQALARQGYYQGPIDGIVGHGTQAAIAAYQRDNGLRVTGTINGGLLDALDLD